MSDVLLREVHLVPVDGAGPRPGPVDVLVRDGVVRAVGVDLRADARWDLRAEPVPVLEGQGRWLVPGLWDKHVHMTQWALLRGRLDTSGTASAGEVLARVAERLAAGPVGATGVLTGYGHRSVGWPDRPTVAALDAVSGAVPVVLISGDAHHGWLNSAALWMLGSPAVEGVVAEGDWFPLYDRLQALPSAGAEAEAAVGEAVAAAHTRGVVGVVDLEFGRPWAQWRDRTGSGLPPLRVRTGVYPEGLQEVLDAGVRTGDPVRATDGLVTMGPLKVITDGSLNTRTAWCCQPYADAHELALPAGAPNLPVDELVDLLATAGAAGLEAALHAIGDRAVAAVLDAFAATGARGSIEHAQLVNLADVPRWAGLPVRASVQPAHLLDDRGVTERCWPDRAHRTFPLRSLVQAGIALELGSDAPVASLDPWLAMAAAVHRGPVDGENWHPEQALSPGEALAASVDGRRVEPGAPADLVLVDTDPLGLPEGGSAAQAARLRETTVSATLIAGHLVHGG